MGAMAIGYIFNFIIILTLFACNSDHKPSMQLELNSTRTIVDTSLYVYNFNKPSKTFILNKKLKEISGLCYDELTNSLFTINDEDGILFQLESSSGSIINSYNFNKKGDYEAIAIRDTIVYITKSNGHIYPYNLITKKSLDKIKTPLSLTNDVEGMCLSDDGKKLLIACKGNPEIEKKKKKQSNKAIYYFDLNTNKLEVNNPQVIQDDQLLQWLNNNTGPSEVSYFKLKNLKNRLIKFAPSAIAQHPISQEYYVLSYQGKLLVILSKDWQVKHIEFLNDQHSQPEGICFGKSGELYISNEANGLIPKLFKYSYNNTN